MIRSGDAVSGGFTARTDVCVVGSGAGGGVAACLLAEAGRDVLVLEEGAHVPRERMTQREEQMYPLLYRDGGNQMTADGGVSVLQGRVVGGSTVVNMADVVPIPDAVLAHWRTRFGVDRWSPERVRAAGEAVSATLGAHRIPDADVNRNHQVLLEGARRLGLGGGVFVHNRVGCVGSGFCLIGCAYDAKRSVALTWIPRALATSRCLVQADARVERLEWEGDRVRAAVGSVIRGSDNRTLAPFRVEADEFVLAAGAIHSPLLLSASGLGGPRVGRDLSLQPQVPVAALFRGEVAMFRGIPQSAYVDAAETITEEGGLGGFRIEGVSATPGMAATVVPLPGQEIHRFMKRFRDVAACLCLVPDRPAGTVTAGRGGRPRIEYPLTESVRAGLKEAARTAARIYLAAGAEAVMLPFDGRPVHRGEDLLALDHMEVRPAGTPLISAHPQGTCRMGPDPATSVVGLDLRVHGVANLRVADASVFPTSASSHTMLPAMQFAWLAASEMVGG
ncbi:GMC family oxidoreductase [Myxococcota bacterium]|nr:GMC family oxidoreductase [Myxococcota bacterium]